MTTAETLEDYQREEIATAFGGSAVINQYASSEGAPFITQDINGELVVNTDTGLFEFVRPGTEEPAGPGELAEMLLTSFTTHAYPLIRYRIGDTVELPRTPRHSRIWDMPVVERILGRREDILYTPERGFVGRLDPVFKKSPSTLIESQIIQTGPTAFTLRVVPDWEAGYHLSQLDGIKEELKHRLGNVEISVEETDALQRGVNGKLRAVVGLSSASSETPPYRVRQNLRL
jgi:phenylacetate-CoA ligase